MKFNYEFRTSDNTLHTGLVSAASREAAFSLLHARGIRPSRMQEAPGLMNKLLGKGKRWLAIGVLAAVAVTAILYPRHDGSASGGDEYADSQGFARPIERRQVWGDSAVIAQAERKNWRVVFPNPACRLLALFAQPGHVLGALPRIPQTIGRDFDVALADRERISPDDLDEYRQMRCIVEGMKQELREYLAAGGTLTGYLNRLQRRQNEEDEYYKLCEEEFKREVAAGKDAMTVWQEINRKLRNQGLPALPFAE